MNGYPLASRWQRLGGYLLDLFIVGIILYLLMSLTGAVEQLRSEAGMSVGQQLIWVAISLALFITLNGYLLAKDGRTLGKQLVGTQIVDLAGEIPPFGRLILLRYTIFILLPLIPILGPIIGLLDSLWIFGREKRCLHDVLAGTKVVTVHSGLTHNHVWGMRLSDPDTKVVTTGSGLTLVARRILQGAGLVAVILVGLIIYRGSLFVTGERLEPGTYQFAFTKEQESSGGDVYVLDIEQSTVTQMTMNHWTQSKRWTANGQELVLTVDSILSLYNLYYALNVNTGEAEQLNRVPIGPRSWWSPDGQYQAFLTQEEGDVDQEIYVAQADGSEQRRLVQNPGADMLLAWSPDGQQIAFWTKLDESWSLSIVNADGTNFIQIAGQLAAPYAPTTGLTWSAPAWSPNGQQVAFWTGQEEGWALSVVNADGTNLKQIARQPAPFPPITGLQWAPDSSHLLFVSPLEFAPWGSIVEAHLFIIDADGQNLIDVGNAYWERRPKWSPDGRMIAFDSYTGRVIPTETNRQRFFLFGCVFSLDAGEPDCPYYDGAYPRWSRDGRYLAYTRDWYGPSSHICVREMTTGHERCFEEITTGGHSPVWRP